MSNIYIHDPTFLFRKIKHQDIVKNNIEGKYRNLNHINVNGNLNIVTNTRPTLDEELVEKIKKNGSNHIMTILQSAKTRIIKFDDDDDDNDIMECDFCRDIIPGNSVGIPIDDYKDEITDEYIYVEIYNHCTFECALSNLKILMKTDPSRFKTKTYRSLMAKFKKSYPNDELHEANPKRLHKNFKGPLDSPGFHKNHYYKKLPNSRILLAVDQYIEEE